ncbi:hypothetical protein [Rugosimonospora africana]|uniref:Dihydrofolate reductase n=1 Tax=Rugosimonospora africana TaxID=556532 RepID=A0A8J3VSU3_9ACTN|nr:hypothetical protein [Rugosimonospora africana]GIH17727.1 hypothetical protein Raf01_58990 [Rugosimonospora africana]
MLDGYIADEHGDFDWSAPDRLRLSLHLLDERRFGNGVAYLRYRVSH